jgi:hypothetical protein
MQFLIYAEIDMASVSLRNSIGSHLLRDDSWIKPTQVWVAIFSVLPDNSGSGGTEVSGGGYLRVQHGPSNAAWNTNGSGLFTNASSVQFASPTANWGTDLPGFGLYSSQTGGIFYGAAEFSSPITVNSGGPAPAFAAGDLSIIIT